MPTGDDIIHLEVKAKISDIEDKIKIIEAIGGKILSTREEIDTYFNTKKGTSLKIKQTGDASSLLYYEFNPLKKVSNFKTVENLNDAVSLIDILSEVLEIKSIISKKKIIYSCNGMNVSFSNLEGLGYYVELQIAVKNNIKDKNTGLEALENLRKILKIKQKDIETHGFGDIICKVNYKI